ncbi:MAG: hypothetical protein OXG39_05765 [Chloroflexi bacterium]|nr:hypothetical protein [Chloroflexota bacterium]
MTRDIEIQKYKEEGVQWLVGQLDKRLGRKHELAFMHGGLWLTFPHPQAEPVTIEFFDLPDWGEMELNDRALLIELFQVMYLQIVDHDEYQIQRGKFLRALRGRNTQLSASNIRALLQVSSEQGRLADSGS